MPRSRTQWRRVKPMDVPSRQTFLCALIAGAVAFGIPSFSSAVSQDIPPPRGYVSDFAGVIDESTEAAVVDDLYRVSDEGLRSAGAREEERKQ